jgi:ATP-dependent Clp protease ATP-binding subunit ClpA
MFERYTESARRVLFFSRYEASQFGSLEIGTEHLLLGLIRESKGLVGRVLAQSHVSLESIRKDTEQRLTSGERSTSGRISTSVELPFDTDAREALQQAAHAADLLRHNYIGTEHLLLGLLRTEGSAAASILSARGLRADDVAARINSLTAGSPHDSARAFLRELFDLAERLSDAGLVIASLHCDWASFGSWTLQAQRAEAAEAYDDALRGGRTDVAGPEVIEVAWDGKEQLLTFETAPTPPLSAPGPWRQVATEGCADRPASIRFAEDYLRDWSSRA